MTLQEAYTRIKELNKLVGTPNEKGFIIDYIIPVPSEKSMQVEFLRLFLNSLNVEESITNFQNEDMEIWALEIKHYKESGVLFYEKIA